MRTNVVIDETLMAEAMRCSGLPTKKAVIEEALRMLVRLKSQERIRDLRGKLQWEGDLDRLRADRESTGESAITAETGSEAAHVDR